MELKTRNYHIIKYLYETKNTTIKELSQKFQVSPRTIRYDLDEIEEILKIYEIKLIRKPHKGISIQGKDEDFQRFKENFKNTENFSSFLTKEERIILILFKLFQSEKPLQIKDFEELLLVSPSTILNDFEEIEIWLKNNNLNLIRKPNYGFKINGEEINIRHAITFLLENTSSEGEILRFLNIIQNNKLADRRLEKNFIKEFDKLIGHIDILKLQEIVHQAQEKLNFKFADSDYAALIVHIALAIKRLRNGKDIFLPESQLIELKNTKEFKIAKEVSSIIEKYYDIKVPESEIGFITFHFLGAKKREKLNNPNFKNNKDNEIYAISLEMSKIFEEIMNIKISQDEDMLRGLYLHLKAALNRIEYNLPLNNPLLKEIKEKYPEIYDATKKASKLIQSNFAKNIDENEIGYIALHFGAAIERNKEEDHEFNAVLVCSSGIGTTTILESRLKKEFPNIKVKNKASVFDYEKESNLKDIDMIISTFELENENLPVIKVNPLLNESDIKKIYQYMKNNEKTHKTKKEEKKINIEDLLKIIKKSSEIENEKKLINDLKKYFTEKDIKIREKNLAKIQQYHLQDILKEKYINSINKVLNWKDAIKKAGKSLLNDGIIEKTYIESCINIIEDKGPYSVIAPGVSLIHAHPEDGVKHAGLSLFIIKKGVNFNHEYDPVKLIFLLAVKDKSKHIPAMGELLTLLYTENFVQNIISFGSSLEILNYIKDILKI
ncbi:BglG family transcription antiterminator [Oceanotoga teriensis]|uniref:BglG family transcription antiterminator n=1 Tax=Oceanotoga teriensis TaxID=515440 RepID=UPI002713C428|nr:BglG family transcription antiterminator [Oceanotoga teriensis]MDO7976032.1 BglG family transcription antiterminator [Oceanotoga teriensis]